MTDISFRDRISENEMAIIEKYRSNVPVKVGALADELGIEVVVAAMPLNISGLIKPKDDSGNYVIKVNRFEPKQRQRFTIAHEIAHFLIHRDRIQSGLVDSTLYRSKLSSRLEAEANRLAADILMPRDIVKQQADSFRYLDGEARVERLSQVFDVSQQAMEIRVGS